MLLDLRKTDVSGKALERRMDAANITANKNAIPFDPKSPFITSGVRLGTPAVTTRGMKEGEMDQIAGFIAKLLEGRENIASVKTQVLELTGRFPLYAQDTL